MTSRSDFTSNAAHVLRERARELARPPERPAQAESFLEVLEFSLANERYAVETRYVREVLPLKDLTPLPCTPPFIRGIVNVRGQILPVFSLRTFFDLPEHGLTDLHRIIILYDSEMEIGLLADAVIDVQLISMESLQPTLPTLTGVRSDYLKGVSTDLMVVLDALHILGDPKIIVHEEVTD